MSLIAVVHVGSGTVSGALLSGRKIVFATEQECRFQEKLDPQIFSQTIAEAFRAVVQSLSSAKLGSPARVAVFLSSPFVAGRLNLLKQNAEKPFKVTEKLIADLIATEQVKLKADTQHTVIDSKIMRFTLNGYEVAAPHGQRASELEVAHYLSLAPRALVEKLAELVQNAFHHTREKIEFHSASFASFLVLRHLRPASQSFLILDISAELSELALVWQNVIWETLSYPLGSHSLLREKATKHGIAPAVARATLDEQVAKNISPAQLAWLDELERSILNILRHRFWSGEIALIAEDDSLAPVFLRILQTTIPDRSVFSSRRVEVKLLQSGDLGALVDSSVARVALPLLVDSAFMLI